VLPYVNLPNKKHTNYPVTICPTYRVAQWLRETLEKLPTWPNRLIDELLSFSAEQLAAI
jgi:hypothetical protein